MTNKKHYTGFYKKDFTPLKVFDDAFGTTQTAITVGTPVTSNAALSSFAANQWALVNEPSVTGNVAAIDFYGTPIQPDHTAEYFEVLVDDGATQNVSVVLLGPMLNRVRRIRVPAGQTTSVQVRVVWCRDGDGSLFTGGWSAIKTVTPSVGSPVLTITPERTSGVAPAGIQFVGELAGTGELRPYHDVDYKWIYPETGDYTTLPVSFGWSRERSVDYGPVSAFVFENPDPTATVTCEATFFNDATGLFQTVTATVDVNIQDPDVIFAGSNTITVGDVAQGDDYDAADIGVAASAIAGAPSGSGRRMSLRRGLSYGDFKIDANFNAAHLSIVAHGTGTDPDTNLMDIRQVQAGGDLSFQDIDPVGTYDPTDPFNTTTSGSHFFTIHAQVPVTINRCKTIGADISIHTSGQAYVSDSDVFGFFNYGIYGRYGHISIIGSMIRQNPLAQRLGDGKDYLNAPFHSVHGPMRFPDEDFEGPTAIKKSVIVSIGNWADTAQPQNPNRWNTSGALAQMLCMDMCEIEGGGFGFGVIPSGPSPHYAPQDIVCDRIRHISTGPAREVVTITLGGTTLRNFIMVQPDTPAETFDTIQSIVKLGGGEGTAPAKFGNFLNPIELYSCAFIDMRSDENATPPLTPTLQRNSVATRTNTDPDYTFTGEAVEKNNIFYAPNRSVGQQDISLEPLDVTAGPSPHYLGAIVTDLVDLDYTGYTGTGKIKSSSGAVLLTGDTSGATGRPYGLDMGDKLAVEMTSEVDFVDGETATLSGEASGQITITTVSARAALIDRFGTPAEATATFAPLGGSSAIGAAVGKVAIRDWYGVPRHETLAGLTRTAYSIGPFEPPLEAVIPQSVAPAFFEDDFDRADSATLGADWVDVTTGWAVSSGQALATGAAFSRPIAKLAVDPTFDDIEVEFDVVTISQRHEVRLRYDGAGNYVYALFNTGSGRVEFGKQSDTNGLETAAQGPVVPDGWLGTWSIALTGDNYTLTHNGTVIQSGTLPATAITSRGVGITSRDGGCVLDNIKVTSLE